MILYNALIFSFGFWNIFKKNSKLSPVLGLAFFASLGLSIYRIINSASTTDAKVTSGVIIMFGLSLLGYILIALSNHKSAQIGALVLAALGVNLIVSNPHTPIDTSIELDPNAELIVRLDHDRIEEIAGQIKALEFVEQTLPFYKPNRAADTELDDYFKVNISDSYDKNEAIDLINQVDGVEWIEPNEIYRLEVPAKSPSTQKSSFSTIVNDPLAAQQWNMEVLNMSSYYKLFENRSYRPNKMASLFILDSGVNPKHEDIGVNFQRHTSPDASANESDGNGHGTHCAGVAAALTNNGKGIASMSPGAQWVTVSSVKVMNNFGFGTQARIVEGIIEAVDAGADVISMSLGGRSSQIKEESYDAAFEYAKQRNVIIVTAAGNNAGDAADITPANSKSVITVSAVDRSLNKAQFSNHVSNTNNGLAAPGTSIVSSWKGGRYSTLDGTSMAAPHVSGLIAVMRSINPNLTTDQAYKILNDTGTKTNQTNLTGKMINPTKAIKALKQRT